MNDKYKIYKILVNNFLLYVLQINYILFKFYIINVFIFQSNLIIKSSFFLLILIIIIYIRSILNQQLIGKE